MSIFKTASGGLKIWLFVLLGVIVFLCLISAAVYGFINGIWNDGISYEKQLTAQYLDNQNYLSAYVSGFYEQVGIAQTSGDQLNEILLDTVKGRYDEGGFSIESPVFAAIVEAYPEAGVAQLMENWGRIQDYIASGREGYRSQQSKLLDMLRSYDTWRETGLIKRMIVRTMGFPSSLLEARLGDTVITGEGARNQMYRIVLTAQALEAYESGTMEPLQVPPSDD